MLDVAVAYTRYQFLGEEFLTWLWFVIENDHQMLVQLDEGLQTLEIGNRMVLANRHNRDGGETVTIKGDHAGMDEGRLTLGKGGMVAEMNLIYKSGDQEWQFNLKGESLNVSNLKVPADSRIDRAEEVEGAVVEKLFLCDKVMGLVNRLYARFIKLRLGNEWPQRLVPQMTQWIKAR
jgi:hypothetical protein